MTQPVTEIAYVILKPGVTIEGDSPAAQVWRDTLHTVSAQDGFQKYYYGTQLENDRIVMLLIDWNSVLSHQNFMASPSYGPFVAQILSITTSIHLHHTRTTTFPPTLLSTAPCIELATFCGCTPTFFEENLKKFASSALDGRGVNGYHGSVIGEVLEDIAKGGGEVEEGKGRSVTLWIGWDSKEAHLKFRDTDIFADNIALLREGFEAVEMFHAHLKTE